MGTQAPTVADLVAAAKATIENLDPDAVAREADGGEPLLVDIREHEEVERQGSIEPAIHAPRGMIEFYADASSPYYRPEFQADRRMILYCASGGRSALAVKALQELGYSNVAHLEGGFNAWKSSGYPTSRPSARDRQR
jgi:rhodanese-related sulfurtransferase